MQCVPVICVGTIYGPVSMQSIYKLPCQLLCFMLKMPLNSALCLFLPLLWGILLYLLMSHVDVTLLYKSKSKNPGSLLPFPLYAPLADCNVMPKGSSPGPSFFTVIARVKDTEGKAVANETVRHACTVNLNGLALVIGSWSFTNITEFCVMQARLKCAIVLPCLCILLRYLTN